MTAGQRILTLAFAALALAGAAGCGGKASPLSHGDIAVVCDRHVTQASFDALMGQGRAAYRLQKTRFPSVGTPKYEQIKQHVLALLVEHAELDHEAAKLGVVVTPKEIDAQVAQIVRVQFKGSDKAFRAALAKQGLTEAALRDTFRSNILQQKLVDRLTAKTKVGKDAIRDYYERYKTQYKSRRSRAVRQILVATKTRAARLEAKLAHGASFTALAKRYSIDQSTREAGGRLALAQGTTFEPVAHVAFGLKTGQISKPVHSHGAWYIVQALGPLQPPKTIPLAQVRLPIVQFLLGQRRKQVVTAWLARVKETCAKGAAFKPGYEPKAT